MTATLPPARVRSDLPERVVSATVMAVVAGVALWLGGMAWTVFVLIVGLLVWFEWRVLVLLGVPDRRGRRWWSVGGAIYCGIACAVLLALRGLALEPVLLIVATVVAVDVGAYAAGRTFGGPKIAPAISPSKTWAGFVGGWLGASLALYGLLAGEYYEGPSDPFAHWLRGSFAGWSRLDPARDLLIGFVVASIAQGGDFFESWMKRRAGVKDSGRLLPGHGGLFDRVDGLVAVLFALGLVLPFGRLLAGR